MNKCSMRDNATPRLKQVTHYHVATYLKGYMNVNECLRKIWRDACLVVIYHTSKGVNNTFTVCYFDKQQRSGSNLFGFTRTALFYSMHRVFPSE